MKEDFNKQFLELIEKIGSYPRAKGNYDKIDDLVRDNWNDFSQGGNSSGLFYEYQTASVMDYKLKKQAICLIPLMPIHEVLQIGNSCTEGSVEISRLRWGNKVVRRGFVYDVQKKLYVSKIPSDQISVDVIK